MPMLLGGVLATRVARSLLQMKFVAVSDTHGCHRQLELPSGDVFLHAGDVCDRGNRDQVIDFFRWIAGIDFQYKVLIWGNHDFDVVTGETLLPNDEEAATRIREDVTLLDQSSIRIGETLIWGIPTSSSKRAENWGAIPDGVDILMTHRPPHGILDLSRPKFRGPQGSRRLSERVKQVRPKIHLFGHIHHGYGSTVIDQTRFINASLYRSSAKRLVNPPVVFDWH